MEASKTESHAARINRVLADRIVSGRLAAGERLRQDHIAEEFGTSHVPVREAFRRLEAQGLVESEPRRGVRVAAFGDEEIREVAQMRASLEVLALRNAAPHLTRSILDAAQDAIVKGNDAKNVYDWEAQNRRFHRTLLTPCGMPRLLRTIDDLHMASARFLFAAWSVAWEMPTDRDHRGVLMALRGGNIDAAASLLERHITATGS